MPIHCRLILAYKPGQLSNRLLQFATFIAFSERTGVRVVNLAFDEYAPKFEATQADLFCRYPAKRSWLPGRRRLRTVLYWLAYFSARLLLRFRLVGRRVKVVSLGWQDTVLLDDDFLSAIKDSWLVFVQGWRIYVPPAVPLEWCGPPGGIDAHREAIRRQLTPRTGYLRRVDELVARARRDSDRLVGVHIRQGDFRTDKNRGRYYYETARYVEKMREVLELYPRERLSFLVCSDQPQRSELFSDLRCTFGGQDAVVDLFALADCDVILGPPSSFSLWAAFYGDRRLCWMFDIREAITRDSFAPFAPVDQDAFAERFYGYRNAKLGGRGNGSGASGIDEAC